MPPRRRPTYTTESIDQQLQQIHLLDPSSPTENLEQLGPVIQQVYNARHQDAYLRTLKALVEAKESEIEQICGENYQDFVSSTSTLLTVRQHTHNLQEKITTLDGSVSSMGKALLTQKQELLRLKNTASNLDEAIDSLQACLRVLDVVNRVNDLIKEGKYWGALRSLEEIKSMVPISLSQTPFFTYLLSSIPSLRNQIKDAVTASNKSWLLHIRNVSGQVGKLALETMDIRRRRWKAKQERDPLLRSSRIGSAVELTSNEGKDVDVLDNDKLRVDFKPLYQCIHIYSALDSLEELQRSYHADRKAQSTLVLPSSLTLDSLPSLTQEIAGFFIIESHVVRTTRTFRAERDVEELWEEAVRRVKEGIQDALMSENDHELFIAVKDCLLGFAMTMEGYGYSVQSLHAAILALLEQYMKLLQSHSGKVLENAVNLDELVPMAVGGGNQRAAILKEVWASAKTIDDILGKPDPPWSTSFYDTFKETRVFATEFYRFVDGVMQHHRFIDEVLGRGLDLVLSNRVCKSYADRVAKMSVLSQIAQIVVNLEYLQTGLPEMEAGLSSLRMDGRGESVPLGGFAASLRQTLSAAMDRIVTIIRSKLVDFFELSEYDWTPRSREAVPSMYLYELVNWLTTVVDSLKLRKTIEDEVYRGAIVYVADSMMDFITNSDLPSMNENALANLLVDLAFLENHLQEIGRDELSDIFTELRNTITIVLENRVQEYINSVSLAGSPYTNVRPKKLVAILEKLSQYSLDQKGKKDSLERELGERRKREAEAISRL